ncbi:putative DNA-binding protein (MmcQ/YjbR family) [Dysgonomonas sp. PFB1-18]|uniref:MmcQ/YjbR family DNA-binding protein n=1 Tax=unclassified Dysgonomonas TaxID=2630389 RepID=UPI002473B858|nr:MULTISPECIES: MmcQ/YjbR family DNA-binding protein [unclassified Dysgonomonas]MDH6309319.1 putative DNA-binding protein (MmcQ/YjbR family) [Dysgonomonas sp. PF1-14]MDH6339816.1 putative DNA-binding protein (MmcQ/YjbR family) [Dysgonomonas sp. PF1-16]MDH6381464.1 putative DNA-binding protein (MmcQ/YjbR family) [Dysgonomonas sp. PFB1-18]MDH6398679.1 putative DNA-binding protein (MmcQ/YjbR family) [Dysgonomonas sp. PF1-23]
MNIEDFRNYCLSIKGATESCPFLDKNILVLKVMDKMFTYINLVPKDGQFRASMKCDPEKANELRERYQGITHGDHTKSSNWNAVYLKSDVPDSLIKELILHSLEEVINKLPKKRREEYKSLQK